MRPVTTGVKPDSYNDTTNPADLPAMAQAAIPDSLLLKHFNDSFLVLQRLLTKRKVRGVAPAPPAIALNDAALHTAHRELIDAKDQLTRLARFDPTVQRPTQNLIDAIPAAEWQAIQNQTRDCLNRTGQLSKIYGQLTSEAQTAIRNVYPNARRAMIDRIGQYCSYCELPIVANLAIEHVVPKTSFPLLATRWSNFLLACAACNSKKGSLPEYVPGPANETPDEAATRMRATFRAPSDADYQVRNSGRNTFMGRFNQEFMYELRYLNRVEGDVLGMYPLSAAEVFPGFLEGRAQFALGPSGTIILTTQLPPIQGPAPNGLETFLSGQPTTIWATEFPPEMRVDGEAGGFGSYIRVGDPVAVNDGHTFAYEHRVEYLVDIGQRPATVTRNGTPPTQASDLEVPSTIRKWVAAQTMSLGWLQGLGHESMPIISVEPDPNSGVVPTRFLFTLTTPCKAHVSNDGLLSLSWVWTGPVELHLLPNSAEDGGPRQQVTIDMLDLNGERNSRTVDRTVRVFDRRVYRRTFAMFAALQAIKNVGAGANGGCTADETHMLIGTITDLARGTGCLTMWHWIVNSVLVGDDNQAPRNALIAALTQAVQTN
jgi:hypothetical protein